MKLYFIRHGESEANTLMVFSNNNDSPYGLTEKGRRQAESAAEKLRGVLFTEFHTSPVPRALQTADILKTLAGLPDYTVDKRLTEYGVGNLEGRSDKASWDSNDVLWRDWFFRGMHDRRHPGGECLTGIIGRFRGWMESVAARYNGSDVNILAVSHGGVLNAALPFAVDNITGEFSFNHPIRNASLVVAETMPEGIRCTVWNDEKLI
ncbi:MAG: histidine phosphatase family protein [Brevinematales bacterium]|nr:histidine phosphatase family protein [Brevinematales bacterium]